MISNQVHRKPVKHSIIHLSHPNCKSTLINIIWINSQFVFKYRLNLTRNIFLLRLEKKLFLIFSYYWILSKFKMRLILNFKFIFHHILILQAKSWKTLSEIYPETRQFIPLLLRLLPFFKCKEFKFKIAISRIFLAIYFKCVFIRILNLFYFLHWLSSLNRGDLQFFGWVPKFGMEFLES